MRRILFLIASLGIIFVGAWAYAEKGREAAPQIRTARITRGPVVSLVEGTGDAQVSQARASLTKATADLQQQEVNLADRRTKSERAEKLAGQGKTQAGDDRDGEDRDRPPR